MHRLAGLLFLFALCVPGCIKAQNHVYYEERWFDQTIDHFRFGRRNGSTVPTRYRQRYLINDTFWVPGKGPWFFYVGNESPVDAYARATGLMWQNAATYGALVLFAEHRYYGKSQPFGLDSWKKDPSYLSTEQAMADYAVLLWNLTRTLEAQHVPIIAFGGSYGGMLAAWMRMKYPHIIAGAVAASAPVAAFPGTDPPFRPSAFWEVVTADATAAAGAAPDCAVNVRAAFKVMFSWGATEAGRKRLASVFRLCAPLKDQGTVTDLAYWVQGAFDAYAMGNYPYESDYMGGTPDNPLPPWPMRAACQHMAGTGGEGGSLLRGLSGAAAVLYNVTGDQECFKLETTGPAAGNSGPWDWQFCTEMMAQELPYFPATGTTDMFWDQGPFNLTEINRHCLEAWGAAPRPHWTVMQYGGYQLQAASNIVFTNGGYDPWSAFGILKDVNPTVVAILIPEGAHHLDLMFSHPADPPSVVTARAKILQHISQWIKEYTDKMGSSASVVHGSFFDDGAAAV